MGKFICETRQGQIMFNERYSYKDTLLFLASHQRNLKWWKYETTKQKISAVIYQ